METALQVITEKFNLTKGEIERKAREVIDELDEGNVNVLVVHICLKAMEELIKKVKDGINGAVLEEAAKYGGKEFDFRGSKVSVANRRTYDYSADTIWANLDAEKKGREQMLKNISEPLADPNTGELIYPAAYKTSQIISITLAK